MPEITLEALKAQLSTTSATPGDTAGSTLERSWEILAPKLSVSIEGIGEFELDAKVSGAGNAYFGGYMRFPVDIPGVGEVMVGGNLNLNLPKKVQAKIQAAAAKLEAMTDPEPSGDSEE